MAELKKPTVAANAAKIDEVSAKVEERAAVVDKALAEKVAKIDAILADMDTLKKENASLKAALEKKYNAQAADAFETDGGETIIEVVAVPPEGVIVADALVWKGKKYKGERVKGFTHYRVPRAYAEVLLTDKSTGVVYYLTGQSEPLPIKRSIGKRARDVVVTPKDLDFTSAGTPYWKDIVVEESK